MKLKDYSTAPSGEGPLASVWNDKPHRLVYDLVAEIERKNRAVDKAKGKLEELERHHVILNARRNRPEEDSETLKLVRAALKELER